MCNCVWYCFNLLQIKLLFDARGDDTSVMDGPIFVGFIDNGETD